MARAEMDKQPGAVSGMFDEVARGYDRTNAVLSLGNSGLWRIATVRAIDPQAGERVLDIAAGTGTSSAAIARGGAEVVALDFSAGMIAEGASAIRRSNSSRPTRRSCRSTTARSTRSP
ncbi:hypothetical protein GCM10025881_16130 [Pseudolysinimonas kribbensis]|uniref:Methyltransferase domain-containing protein n=1 Tax=Pseudolysinimonas kribbensis TaxID=433641 RepID=A0ABQ6K685_9MICO|nr:hypothetical protein GCM10025881_16130 [Pseudolysinimonas kribbensis]